MPFQVVIEVEPRPAYVTSERLLARVDHFVPFQSSARPVRPVAHVAHERTVARVLPLMHSQGVGIFEGLLTHRALVFLGVRVNHLVEAKGVFALELFPARRAAERAFFRMHRHVTPQLDRRLAGLVTELALQHLLPLLVAQQVVFQRWPNPECFPALIAGERLWRFRLLVAFEVILKRQLSSEGSLALRTREWQRHFGRLVPQKVIFKRALFEETSTTLLTRKRLLVGLHVFLQLTFPMKTNVTVLTEEPLPGLRLSFS